MTAVCLQSQQPEFSCFLSPAKQSVFVRVIVENLAEKMVFVVINPASKLKGV